MISFEITHRDPGSKARVGRLRTAHGEVETPAFLPLATKGAVRALVSEELRAIGVQILMANTYHLFLQPGPEIIRGAGGLHRFTGWDGPIMTDSGGFQVFSLWYGHVADEIKGRRSYPEDREVSVIRVEEDGILFKSYIDGSLHWFSPETSMEVQHALGSDIAVVLDECTPYHATYDYTRKSMERTHRWAIRSLKAHEKAGMMDRQALFGIVQGGIYRDLREESARVITSLPVQGICIGGSLGKDKEEMSRVVSWVVPFLPEGKPRHLLGIGEPDDLVHGVEQGMDLFDCAFPTRLGRHGMLLVRGMPRFRMDVTKGVFAKDFGPVDPDCSCTTCQRYTRAYLHHLFKAGELTGVRLATLHNLAWILKLLQDMREAIKETRFQAWKEQVLKGEVLAEGKGQGR